MLKRTVKRLLNHIPTRLPQGVTEFETWSNDIIDTYEMPNNDSIKFAIAVAILHLKNTDAFMPKSFFGNILIKGAASQVAGFVMQECKARQEALVKAAQEQPVEATTSPGAVADDTSKKD